MNEPSRTHQVLIEEISILKQRIQELEQSESELKQAEEALQESEVRYRKLIETTRDLIYTTDRKGFLTYMNPTLERTLNYIHAEWNGKTFAQIVAPECIDSVKDLFKRAMSGESIPVYSVDLIRKDGTRLSVEFNVVTIYDSNGKPSDRYGIGRDVTDRKRAEDALRESEKRLQSIVDGSPIPAFVIGKDHRVIHWNKALEEMSRIKPGEVLGTRDHWKAFYNEERPCMADLLVDEAVELVPQWYSGKYIKSLLIEDAYEATDFFPAMGQDGKWLRFTAAAIRDSKGMIVAAIETLEDITDRKRAEEARLKSEERFRITLMSIGDGVITTDAEGRVDLLNPVAENLSGWSHGEARGKPLEEVFHIINEETRQPVENPVFHVLRDGLVVGLANHTLLIARNGTERPIADSGAPIFGADGAITGTVLVFRDQTEERKAQNELKALERRLSKIIDFLPDPTLAIDSEKRVIVWNRAMEELTGVPAAEMLGKGDYVYTIPFYGMARPQLMDLFWVPGHEIAQKYPAICKDRDNLVIEVFCPALFSGKGAHVWAKAAPLCDAEGRLIGAIESIRDITERKQAEEMLREKEEKFRTVADFAYAWEYWIAPDGKYIYVSPACERISGYRVEEFQQDPHLMEKIIHPDDRHLLAVHIQDVLPGKSDVCELEFRIITRIGKVSWVNHVCQDVYSHTGEYLGRRSSNHDITERKRAEEETKRLESQLKQAQKLESIGTLAGGIAHDFNNLLMGIQGYASLMLLDLDSSHPHYERLKRMEQMVASGADLTKQLLGFARGGRYEVKPTDMNDVLEKSSSMFGRTKKEISIHRKYGKDLWSVEVDRGQMEQVFMNLYVNAWQAMPGGGEIYLETDNVLLDDEQAFPYAVKPGRYIKISVTDTGTGMDEKTRERIFDPFFTTKEMGRGSGLGLATVYGIIKGHKGMINVDSEPGQGTTFTIYLPASEKEVVKERTATGTIARGAETILLVDDEKIVLEVSKELLESMGYLVYAVGSGQEALAVYMEKRNDIDLVILDMILPGISGGETFDRLREIDPEIRVLLSSGYSIEGEAQHILKRGCNGFIQKPFQLENISERVREVLGG